MVNELPTLGSTDKELESIYEVHSNKFFHWLKTKGISPNSSRDIALLAHNELVKRSNNKFSRKSVILTNSVLILSVITLSFAFLDYVGDKKWQKDQIIELQNVNKNLTKRSTQIESLKLELSKSNEKIMALEKQIELSETQVKQKKK